MQALDDPIVQAVLVVAAITVVLWLGEEAAGREGLNSITHTEETRHAAHPDRN